MFPVGLVIIKILVMPPISKWKKNVCLTRAGAQICREFMLKVHVLIACESKAVASSRRYSVLLKTGSLDNAIREFSLA